ncbi:polysaccharide deacetylase family protein [Bradyrhizobium genosp. A]|uniref:polysaccharide deacetylase family protein n=1 Tax=Bradyrhizobium genosp. A TaxID=83626 RepID=UPI003CF7B2B2
MKVVLTIDNGPYPDVTPTVLDALAERNIKAVFFVIGKRLDEPEYRALAERAHAEGHIVANHSFHHETLLGDFASDAEAVAEIALAQDRLNKIGASHRLFRPFAGMGQINDRLLHAAALDYLCREKFTLALWNSVPRDWERPNDWDVVALSDVQTRDSSVIVVHDLPTGAMTRLGAFIDGVHELGGSFSTDLPDDCAPIRGGRAAPAVESLVRLP